MFNFVIWIALVASCVTAGRISGRIFNGSVATEIPPYHAQLLISNTVNPADRYMGSGTLVSTIHLLTTALNIVGYNQWQAGFGSLTFAGLTYFEATGAVIHEDYDATTTLNNIGVIFFGNGIIPTGDQNIVPIAIPSAGNFQPASDVTGSFSSFGFTSPTGPASNVLLYSTQTVISEETCANLFAFGTLSGQFCALDPVQSSSPCAGEQGSAFVIDTDNGPLAVGLVSATIGGCNVTTAVTYYIRLNDYRPWLSSRFGI